MSERGDVFNKQKNRSPLKEKPLRVAGQSLDETIQAIRDGEMTEAAAIGALSIAMAAYEWLRWYQATPPQPLVITLMAVAGVTWALWRIRRARRLLLTLRQGRDGERAVAEVLEQFRDAGFLVLHDMRGPDFNVDHVLIGPPGLYVIETKTMTKPANADATIDYDGEQVTLSGLKPERDPIRQARALAKWMRDVVKESTGRDFRVRPVVLYPGWFIPNTANRNQEVWVLNPTMLRPFVKQEPQVLAPEEVKLIAYHLSRHVRTTPEK